MGFYVLLMGLNDLLIGHFDRSSDIFNISQGFQRREALIGSFAVYAA